MLLPILMLLSACANDTSVSNTYCLHAFPITYSDQDTPETIAQVERHDVIYDRLCP